MLDVLGMVRRAVVSPLADNVRPHPHRPINNVLIPIGPGAPSIAAASPTVPLWILTLLSATRTGVGPKTLPAASNHLNPLHLVRPVARRPSSGGSYLFFDKWGTGV